MTIKGSGFGKLPPHGRQPAELSGVRMRRVAPGYDGLDFGSNVWLNDLGLFQASSARPGGGGIRIGL